MTKRKKPLTTFQKLDRYGSSWINMKMEGMLTLTEQLRALGLSAKDKRMLHIRMADAIARAMKKEIRAFVGSSDLKYFDGSERHRRRKARYFARQVGRRATATNGIIFDRRTLSKERKSDRATDQQAERMRELGFRMSKTKIKLKFSYTVAWFVISKIEAQKGLNLKNSNLKSKRSIRRSMFRRSSLLMLVWREKEEEIMTSVDLNKIVRRFLNEKMAAA